MEAHFINLLGLKMKNLQQKEIILIDIYIYHQIFKEIYSHLEIKKPNNEEEPEMFDGVIIRKLANDLIANQDYSLDGLAQYTGYPEEVIYELIAGINNNPTITLANKIIELHVMARRELYISYLRDAIKMGNLSIS